MKAAAQPRNSNTLRMGNIRRAAGFSLFELVVFIISVAIIYAYAANRFAEFPGQAERANFLAITTQIQTAINLEMMFGVGLNRISSPALMEGTNPMEYMLEPPANYVGEFDVVDTNRIERRIWYFDRQTEELVYLVNDSQGVYLLVNGIETPTEEIRFRIVVDYGEVDTTSGLPVSVVENEGVSIPPENRERRFNGVVMRPVYPYIWGEVDEAELRIEPLANNSG